MIPRAGLHCAAILTLLFAVASPHAGAHGTHSGLMSLMNTRLLDQPQNGELWYRRALLQYEHEDWAETALDLAKAEKFAPGQFPTLWWQGQVLDQLGKTEEAKSVLDEFLAKTPAHWGALASRARVETKLGLNDKALADFRASLANCPEAQPDLIQEVAQALATSGLTGEATGVLEAGLKRLGPIPSLQLKILEVEVNAAAYDSALSRLDAMQRSASRPEPWMEKRAAILAQAGRLAESRAAWQSITVHLKALPPAERDSHAMTLLSERAHSALAVLDSVPSSAATSRFASPQNP